MSKKKELKRINIDEIQNPNFLHDLSYKELDLFSEDVRKKIIEVTAKNGGHLSSNLGVVEPTIALCRCFDFSKDKIVFDVGHQCYTYKILTGRSLERLRKSDGPAGFQRMSESPYDHFEAGHSSTSISAALGMAISRDLNHENYDVIAFIGDASITNGLALEGLNNLANSGHKIIIIFNDNDMSITKPVGGLAKSFRSLSNSALYRRSKHTYQKIMKTTKLGRWILRWTSRIKNWIKRHVVAINLFDNLGLSYIGPVDGHDIKHLEKAISKAKKIDNSVVIHIKTIKGKGYKYAENDDSGSWHGVSGFDIETGKQNVDPNKVSWSHIYSDALLKTMCDNDNVIAIVPATGTGSALEPIFDSFPHRIIDVGIAEEHAVTMAGGLAASGKHPVVSIYSTFLQRAFDELSHDIARMHLNATFLIDRSGLVGADGTTHQGIYDESFLISTPNTVVTMASREEEAYGLMKESLNNHGVFCIRYPRMNLKPTHKVVEAPFGKWIKELDGDKAAVISVGPLTIELKEFLINKNVALYNASYQKPLDEEAMNEIIKQPKIIIYDAYATVSGFASFVSEYLITHAYKGEVVVKAIPDVFVTHATIDEQLERYGLKPEDIAKLL